MMSQTGQPEGFPVTDEEMSHSSHQEECVYYISGMLGGNVNRNSERHMAVLRLVIGRTFVDGFKEFPPIVDAHKKEEILKLFKEEYDLFLREIDEDSKAE